MKMNFFSVLLVMLTMLSFGKILFLFDRIMINTANIETRVTSIFMLDNAIASPDVKKEDPLVMDDSLIKSIKDAKTEKNNLISSKDSAGHVNSSGKTKTPLVNEGIENILDVGLTGDEIKLLKELSKRREKLDQYEHELSEKESLLNTTEEKLEGKMADLKNMQDKVNGLLKQLDAKSSLRVKSLAKIYENMKPQEAAKIFDELEMPILLEVMHNMKEIKVAPIIAQMNPSRAKEVSLEFTKLSPETQNIFGQP